MPPNTTPTEFQHWQLALDSVHEGIWSWDLTTDVYWACERWHSMLGYSRTELQLSRAEQLQYLVHEDDWPVLQSSLLEYVNQRPPMLVVSMRLRCKNGRWKRVLCRGKATLWSERGQVLRLHGLHTDLEALHNAMPSLVVPLHNLPNTTVLPSPPTLNWSGPEQRFSDFSELSKAHHGSGLMDAMLNDLQHIARVGCAVADYETGEVFWTLGVYLVVEADPATFVPNTQSIRQFLTAHSRKMLLQSFKDPQQPERHEGIYELLTATGRLIWVRSIAHMTWADGRVATRTEVLQDITEQVLLERMLRDSEATWRHALDSSGDGIWEWHIQTSTMIYSERLLALYNLDVQELGSSVEEMLAYIHPDDIGPMQQALRDHLQGKTPRYHCEHRVLTKSGLWKWVQALGTVISRDEHGKPLRMVGTHTDISTRKEAEEALRHQALYDSLTGLPNRVLLREQLSQAMQQSQITGQQLALMFIDLDYFKEVNDTLGHDHGDALLVKVAHRLLSCLQSQDTLARMGGDEFTILVPKADDLEELEKVLKNLLMSVMQGFKLGDEYRFISASIGVTLYPRDGSDIETLLRNADQALYLAKGAGRSCYRFFTAKMQEDAQRRARIANDLRIALHEEQFHLVYQPIVDLDSGRVYKAEALLRWKHPRHGLIDPEEFTPIAESSGLILELGDWVFLQVTRQVQHWRLTLAEDFQLSLNKSPVQFQRGHMHHDWEKSLRERHIPPQALAVEITENILVDSDSSVSQQLHNMVKCGMQIALDDFGKGYSSLAYLQRFDIQYIKIDRQFVRNLKPDSKDLSLCQAMIAMAHALGIRTVAEGVETRQQLDLLRLAGCDFAQGYYLARPMSIEAFETFYTTLEDGLIDLDAPRPNAH
ncbi:EAL domain-containing protein [Curvibacter sp. CHRR-16]|uniref:bifunctional diguanylate cyclase/phosphodiesterase n=1 Tax=Curvibacter sp. CHRR-16 TaxID=2835872 RepID=UPI001BDA3FFD|nr:EAL domain-containing protein [Curvibacter sp. CHRR-16]